MVNVLVVLVSVLIALVAIGLAALSQMAKRLQRATVELDKKLGKLERRLDEQDKSLAALRKTLDQRAGDPIMELVHLAQGWRAKGPWPTLVALGSRVFRSYWGQKRTNSRALPVPKEAKK